VVSPDLIPTGHRSAVDGSSDLRNGRIVSQLHLDTPYPDVIRPSVIRWPDLVLDDFIRTKTGDFHRSYARSCILRRTTERLARCRTSICPRGRWDGPSSSSEP
jgi:hypothetical protein